MALNFPSSPSDLQLYTDPNLVQWRYDASKGVWDKFLSEPTKQFFGAKLILTNNKSLSANLLSIEFDDVEFDTSNYFNFDEYPSRITINRTGYYRLNLIIGTSNQGTGASYTFSIKKNGNITISNDTAGPNQYLYYDDIVLLYSGDYVELYGSDSSSIGEITTDSFFEIERIGIGLGTPTTSSTAFSGVKVILESDVLLTSTPTSIEWDNAPINVNADSNGNLYWNNSVKSDVSIYTNGYYRIKGMLETNTLGSSNSYTISLRAAGSELETTTIGPNERIDIDETYYITSGSIVDMQVSNSSSIGSITSNSFLLITRQGI